jgi:hypothetical protein
MDSRGETGNGVGEAAELPQERAVYVARTLGARFLLLGEADSVPPRLSLSARLVCVRDGSVAYRASVDGPADSLTEAPQLRAAAGQQLEQGSTSDRGRRRRLRHNPQRGRHR